MFAFEITSAKALLTIERSSSLISSASKSESVPTRLLRSVLGSSARRVYVPKARTRTGPKSTSRIITGFGVPHFRSVMIVVLTK